MSDLYSVIKGPWVTEKATLQKERGNQVAFEVDRGVNKLQIKRAVEEIFKVRVLGVQTVSIKGKPKKVGRYTGHRSDKKKAIVRLYPGEKIEFLEGA